MIDTSNLRVGETIRTTYGRGVVAEIADGWIRVRYGEGRELTLDTTGAELRIGSSSPAPTPPRLGLVPKHQRGQLALLRRDRWIGSKEGGPPGQSQNALADRGVAESRVAKKPYPRQVARLTPLGALYLETHDPKWRANEQSRAHVAEVERARVAAGVCRHCGGPIPCWSPYGDVLVGVRRVE